MQVALGQDREGFGPVLVAAFEGKGQVGDHPPRVCAGPIPDPGQPAGQADPRSGRDARALRLLQVPAGPDQEAGGVRRGGLGGQAKVGAAEKEVDFTQGIRVPIGAGQGVFQERRRLRQVAGRLLQQSSRLRQVVAEAVQVGIVPPRPARPDAQGGQESEHEDGDLPQPAGGRAIAFGRDTRVGAFRAHGPSLPWTRLRSDKRAPSGIFKLRCQGQAGKPEKQPGTRMRGE